MFRRALSAALLFCSVSCVPAQEAKRQIDLEYKAHKTQVETLMTQVSAEDADALFSTVWLDCFYLRDLDAATDLASAKSLDSYGFWRDAFGILGGKEIDRLEAVRRYPENSALSEDTTLVLGKLFSLKELRQAANRQVRALADGLGPVDDLENAKPEMLLRRSERAAAKQMDAESFQLAVRLPIDKLGTPDIISVAMRAVASCHYREAATFYVMARDRIARLPAAQRNLENGGLAFAYLSFYMKKPLLMSSSGLLIADGVEVAVSGEVGAAERMVAIQQLETTARKQ